MPLFYLKSAKYCKYYITFFIRAHTNQLHLRCMWFQTSLISATAPYM